MIAPALSLPPSELSPRQVRLVIVGLFGLIAVLVLTAPLAIAAPFVLVAGVLAFILAVASPWHGLAIAVGATMLLPNPFSVRVAGATLTIGRLLLFSVIAGWFVHRSRNYRPTAPRSTPLDLPLIALVGLLVASTIANLERFRAFELAGAIRRTALYTADFVLVFFVVVGLTMTAARRHNLVRILGGLVGFTAVLGIIENFTGQNIYQVLSPVLPRQTNVFLNQIAEESVLARGSISRLRSTFNQPLVFGTALAMGLPLVIGLRAVASSARERWLWTFALAAIGPAVLFTLSRSVYLVAGVVVLTMGFMLPNREARRSVFAAVAATVVLFVAQENVRTTMLAFFTLDQDSPVFNTVNARTADYAPIIELVAERPALGYGPRSFFGDQVVRAGLIEADINIVLDNTYLLIYAETGILGLFSIVWIFATALIAGTRAFRRARDPDDGVLALSVTMSAAAFVLMGLAADVFVFSSVATIFFVLLGLIASYREGTGWVPRVGEARG